MKNIFKIKRTSFLLLLLAVVSMTFTSCLVDDDAYIDKFDDGPNIVGFENNQTLAAIPVSGNGQPLNFKAKVRVVGPNMKKLNGDIKVTFSVVDSLSTAVAGTHYTLTNNSVTISKSTNYLAPVPIKILTQGITPPLKKVLTLKIESISGATGNVILSGKNRYLTITVSYICVSDLAGDYALANDPSTTVTITETGPGQYTVGDLITVTPSGFDWYIVDECGQITVTGFELSSYTLTGTGVVNPDGSINFNDIELQGVTGPIDFKFVPIP